MRYLLLSAISALGLAAVLYAAGDDFPGADPHASFRRKDLCPRCHVYSGSRIVAARFAADADTVCHECHAKEHLGRIHPMGFPAEYGRGMTVPEGYPLNVAGRMMCLTCHFAHKAPYLSREKSWPTQQPVSGVSGRYFKTFYLRRTDPKGVGTAALCDGCHKKK